jgi:hypothetical protein
VKESACRARAQGASVVTTLPAEVARRLGIEAGQALFRKHVMKARRAEPRWIAAAAPRGRLLPPKTARSRAIRLFPW